MSNVFAFGCLAQVGGRTAGLDMKTMGAMGTMPEDGLAIVAYHVQERINMNFGSSITTYEVSRLSLVNTNELGANNSRVVKKKYGKARAKIEAIVIGEMMPKVPTTLFADVSLMEKFVRIPPKFVNINILSTYERIIDRGYKTPDMLKRVANARFFDNDLVMAEKWYTQLFSLTTDLEAIYFYRYAQSLKAVGQTEKAEEMMNLFKAKDL